jgi:hypothetical protein
MLGQTVTASFEVLSYNSITPWSRGLLEKLIVSQIV